MIIFVVEDEPFFANLINFDLKSNFNDIRIFFSGEECVSHLDLHPDVVILDHQLPGMSGLEALQKIKAFDPDIHVIFLSGSENPTLGISAFKFGAHDFLVKNDLALDELQGLLKKIEKGKRKEKALVKIRKSS